MILRRKFEVESLTERIVPARTLYWSPPDQNATSLVWSNGPSWRDGALNGPALTGNDRPTLADNVVFASVGDCKLDSDVTVNSVNFNANTITDLFMEGFDFTIQHHNDNPSARFVFESGAIKPNHQNSVFTIKDCTFGTNSHWTNDALIIGAGKFVITGDSWIKVGDGNKIAWVDIDVTTGALHFVGNCNTFDLGENGDLDFDSGSVFRVGNVNITKDPINSSFITVSSTQMDVWDGTVFEMSIWLINSSSLYLQDDLSISSSESGCSLTNLSSHIFHSVGTTLDLSNGYLQDGLSSSYELIKVDDAGGTANVIGNMNFECGDLILVDLSAEENLQFTLAVTGHVEIDSSAMVYVAVAPPGSTDFATYFVANSIEGGGTLHIIPTGLWEVNDTSAFFMAEFLDLAFVEIYMDWIGLVPIEETMFFTFTENNQLYLKLLGEGEGGGGELEDEEIPFP